MLEATEYLGDLDTLAGQNAVPDMERMIRGARGLRGAALMAGLGTFARAAAGLESLARGVRDHALSWEPEARDGWREGLQTLRLLMGRAVRWEAADDRQALAMSDRVERIIGGHVGASLSASMPGTTTPRQVGLTAGVRAFIARESALIAGSLQDAARALAPLPPPDALAAVLERMRSLRGLGASSELSPLPELLDAMEVTTRTLLAAAPAPPDVALLFGEAAGALAAMAQSVAESGRVTVPPGLDAVARRLLDSYAGERDVIDMASLAPEGVASVVTRGVAPSQNDAEPIPVELIGVGDHLLLQADALDHAPSSVARDLRLFSLHRTLATMPRRSGTARFLSPLVRAITHAISAGLAASDLGQFTAMLRDSGRFLVETTGTTDAGTLAVKRDALARTWGVVPEPVVAEAPRQLSDPTTTIEDLTGTPIVHIASLAPDGEDDVVPIASLVHTDAGEIVSIESLVHTDDAVVSIESLAPGPTIPAVAPGQPGRLERAMQRLRELDQSTPYEPPSLAGLVADPVHEVTDLLYRGPSALARSEEVRQQLIAVLAEPMVSLARLRPLLDELLDLVPLARDAA